MERRHRNNNIDQSTFVFDAYTFKLVWGLVALGSLVKGLGLGVHLGISSVSGIVGLGVRPLPLETSNNDETLLGIHITCSIRSRACLKVSIGTESPLILTESGGHHGCSLDESNRTLTTTKTHCHRYSPPRIQVQPSMSCGDSERGSC